MQEINDQLYKVNTIEEAEQIIYSMIKIGKNNRDILKTKFQIDDKTVGFNASKVKKIKEKFENVSSTKNKDPDKALIFKCFKKEMKPVDVVIETGLSYECVKQAYGEFLELVEMVPVSRKWLQRLDDDARIISGDFLDQFGRIEIAMANGKECFLAIEDHVFSCAVCGQKMYFDEISLQPVQDYLSQRYGHAECIQQFNQE